MATRGSSFVRWRAIIAVVMAMSASCSAVGSGITLQSARKSDPSKPTFCSSQSRIISDEAVCTCSRRGMIWNSGRSALEADTVAPPTRASTWPAASIIVAK